MPTQRNRTIVDLTTVPELPRYVRLQFSEIRNAWAVLAPERVLWPDAVSLDILKRCNGRSSTGDIVTGLCADYNAPREQVESDVVAFLQEWTDDMLVRCVA